MNKLTKYERLLGPVDLDIYVADRLIRLERLVRKANCPVRFSRLLAEHKRVSWLREAMRRYECVHLFAS